MGVILTLYPFRALLPYRWEMKMCSNFFKVLNTSMKLFFQLTCVCLPDGIHASNRDTQFFIIQDYKYPLYGISCYEQIKSQRDDQHTTA